MSVFDPASSVSSRRMMTRSALGRSTQRKPRRANTPSRPRCSSPGRRTPAASGQASIAGATLVPGERDRGAEQGDRDSRAAVSWLDEGARHQPHVIVLVPWPAGQEAASTLHSGGVAAPRTAGAPADRVTVDRGQHAHRSAAGPCHGLEPAPVPAAVPAGREVPPARAERHAPAVAGRSSAVEQGAHIVELIRPDGSDLDRRHERERTPSAPLVDAPSAGMNSWRRAAVRHSPPATLLLSVWSWPS